MTKPELYQAAQVVADHAINHCPNDLWEKLEEHAIENWSCDPASLIRMAIEQGFGVLRD